MAEARVKPRPPGYLFSASLLRNPQICRFWAHVRRCVRPRVYAGKPAMAAAQAGGVLHRTLVCGRGDCCGEPGAPRPVPSCRCRRDRGEPRAGRPASAGRGKGRRDQYEPVVLTSYLLDRQYGPAGWKEIYYLFVRRDVYGKCRPLPLVCGLGKFSSSPLSRVAGVAGVIWAASWAALSRRVGGLRAPRVRVQAVGVRGWRKVRGADAWRC